MDQGVQYGLEFRVLLAVFGMHPAQHSGGRVPFRSSQCQDGPVDEGTGEGGGLITILVDVESDPDVVCLAQTKGLCPAVQAVFVEVVVEDPVFGIVLSHDRRGSEIQGIDAL